MITKPTIKHPTIEWEITNELIYDDIDERMLVYLAYGYDEQGHNYSGSAEYSCGELIKINDIEEIKPNN